VTELLWTMVPSWMTVAVLGPAALALGGVAAWSVSRLHAKGVRVAYTRKVFHFMIFTAAAVVHAFWHLPGTVVFGTVIAGLVLMAVGRGEGDGLYEALARDSDRPHRSLFILVPLATTAVGGLASALLTGPYAAVGYLAAGWGDAVGEPVGARWGRHPYRVPSLAGVPATRTLEGSLAVFLTASAGATVALGSLGHVPWWAGVACGVVAATTEAVSAHGLDNLTVQIIPSLFAAWLLAG
jgi:phytol kinase